MKLPAVRPLTHRDIRPALLFVALSIVLIAAQPVTAATRLLMFESSTCEWCDRWHEEIGPAYPKTRLGRIAPLLKVSVDDKRPDRFRSVRGIVYTPTFVLWHKGKEVGRLVGYPGEDFFWPLLEKLIRKLPKSARKK